MIFKDRSRSFCPMNNGVNYKAEALSIRNKINSKASINYSREKSCVCGISIVAYQDYRDRCRPHKRRNYTRGTECACAQYCARC